jgi:integrating conjugative element protein (TIGR03749 family)
MALLLLGTLQTGRASATEIERWERLPIPVPLIVGQERVLFVDRDVRVGIPANIRGLRVQSAAGAVYLRADAPIDPPERVQLQDAETGLPILIDLSARRAKSGEPPLEPLKILTGARQDDARPNTATSHQTLYAQPGEPPLPMLLTRYAAQTLYAPTRAVEPVPGIARARIDPELALPGALLPGALLPAVWPVQARALAAWRRDDMVVTAIRLTNTSTRGFTLDARLLQSEALQRDCVAATFQHSTLGPVGEATDTTVLYLITRGRDLSGVPPPSAPGGGDAQ